MTTGFPSIYMIEGESLNVAAIAKRTGLHPNTAYKFLRRCQSADVVPTWAGFPKPREGRAAQSTTRGIRTHAKPTPFQIGERTRDITKPARGVESETETVEAWQARGGQIQVCTPHETSSPMRFDHGDRAVPIGRRRPAMHARPAPYR